MNVGRGKTAKDAFASLREEALHEHGHGGYSGTIAEKRSFVMIECPIGVAPCDLADQLIENDDKRIVEKFGPAGCIRTGEGTWFFFGWASE